MAIIFDKTNKVILIEKDQTEITIQNLINAIRDWEDELVNLEEASAASATGKQDLGAGVKVGITLELINNWRIQFEARDGPNYISCIVTGGNLVATNDYDDNPIKPSAFTQITIAQSSSATVSEGTGGGLSDEEHSQLMESVALEGSVQSVAEKSDQIQADVRSTRRHVDNTKKEVDSTKKEVEFIRSIEGGRWRILNNQMIFFGADNKTEVARFELLDKNGKPTERNVMERRRV